MAAAYPLQSLLTVRHIREDRAQRDVVVAQTALKAAHAEVVVKQKALSDWQAYRLEETERRYASLIGKTLSMTQLETFHQGLAHLALTEESRRQDVENAQNEAATCENRLESAKVQAAAAARNTAKIQAHKDIWLRQEKKEDERRQDLELEEFRPVIRQESSEDD